MCVCNIFPSFFLLHWQVNWVLPAECTYLRHSVFNLTLNKSTHSLRKHTHKYLTPLTCVLLRGQYHVSMGNGWCLIPTNGMSLYSNTVAKRRFICPFSMHRIISINKKSLCTSKLLKDSFWKKSFSINVCLGGQNSFERLCVYCYNTSLTTAGLWAK